MVLTSLEIKKRSHFYGNAKEIIDDGIDISSWMTENSLNCSVRRLKQKISNNQIIHKEESETDKSLHQPSVLGLICTSDFNGGRQINRHIKN